MMALSYRDVVELVRQFVAGVVRFSPVAGSSADGHGDKVQGRTTPSDPDVQIGVRRMFPFGLRSRPPAGVDGLVVHANGGASNGVLIAAESSHYGPSALNDGETAIYSKTNPAAFTATNDGATTLTSTDGNGNAKANVALNAQGDIIGTPASGRTFQLGGTTPIARKNDAISNGTIQFTPVGTTYLTGITILYTPGDGSAPQTLALTTTSGAMTLTLHEKINAGSSISQSG